MTSLKGKIKVMEEEKERLGEKVERARIQVGEWHSGALHKSST